MQDIIEFITGIENYYGAYPVNSDGKSITKEMVMKYVDARFKGKDLMDIFKQIIIQYSNQYKTPPDVAKIREIFSTKTNYEAQAEKAWELVESIKTNANPVVFEDTKIQIVIKNNWQTWDNFYLRKSDHENRVWIKKDFIHGYILQCEINGKAEHEILKGYRCLNNNSNPYYKPEIIYKGNEENKLAILSTIDRLQISSNESIKQIGNITQNILAGVKQ